jgi:hypothetical protein
MGIKAAPFYQVIVVSCLFLCQLSIEALGEVFCVNGRGDTVRQGGVVTVQLRDFSIAPFRVRNRRRANWFP